LAIGIIVKNEEKNLALCLDSLDPLRKAVDCKVIIADTVSTDGTKKVAEARADIYFEHTWNTDFSEARNAIFSKVDAEWFMYIDADEILPETEILTEFFTSGEYKNYDCASVDIHTAFYKGYEHFSNAIRLVKFTPETRFVGKINERFTQIPEKCKLLKITLEHSGYEPELLRAKELRNVAMSRMAAESEDIPDIALKNNISIFDALCKYDIFEAEKAWDEALRLSEKTDPYYKNVLYIRKMQFHFVENEYDKTLELHEKYMMLCGEDCGSDLTRLVYSDIEDAFFTGAAAARSKNYSLAVKMLTRFEDYYKYYTENYERFSVNRRFYPAVNTSSHMAELAADMLTATCMESKEYEYALSRLMKKRALSNDITICMDNTNDFSFLAEFMAIPGADAAVWKYVPSAVHPIDLTKAATEIVGEDSDFAIIYRYLTEPFDCGTENLHAKKTVIEYLTATKSEPEDLEFLVNNYISEVYVTSDSIHYSDLITSARRVLDEKSEKLTDI
jgi:glycosyltransferase involved in cell wall biosynthesis